VFKERKILAYNLKLIRENNKNEYTWTEKRNKYIKKKGLNITPERLILLALLSALYSKLICFYSKKNLDYISSIHVKYISNKHVINLI
jgi:hypothetical protein